MFEILSFLIPMILGKISKVSSQRHEREIAILNMRENSKNNAFKRSLSLTGDTFSKWWRVPVRPVITYVAWFAFFSLPFVAMFYPVNMEMCQIQTGFFAWLLGQENAICNYTILTNGITWTHTHTLVTMAVSGYWFGSR